MSRLIRLPILCARRMLRRVAPISLGVSPGVLELVEVVDR